MSNPERPTSPTLTYRIGRGIQLLAFVAGSGAMVMTFSVMGEDDRSTAPALGLALLSGAVFTIGWLTQRWSGWQPPRND